MDLGAYEIAHAALGVAAGPAIEVSIGGLALECVEGAVTIAVAGGGFLVSLDAAPFGSWFVATIRAGSRLSIRIGPWGSWTYLAFAGRLQASTWLGSASTHSISGFGGGRLVTGQRLTVEDAEVREERVAAGPLPGLGAPPRTNCASCSGRRSAFSRPRPSISCCQNPMR